MDEYTKSFSYKVKFLYTMYMFMFPLIDNMDVTAFHNTDRKL